MYGEISLLTCSGFLKNRMIRKGVHQLTDIINGNTESLSKILKVSSNQINELKKETLTLLNKQMPSFDSIFSVSTLSLEIDNFLGGGLKTQALYEFIGLPGSGRSTFALNIANLWLNSISSSKVFYLDTEGSIGCKENSKILYMRVLNERQIFRFIKEFCVIVPKGSLVIIDSLWFLLKEAWLNDKKKAKLVSKLGMEILEKVHITNSCLIFINGLNSNDQVFFGESWGSIITNRLLFSKSQSGYKISF